MKINQFRKIALFLLASFLSLPNQAYAINPCGSPTAGGTITCNGDGNPANDLSNMPNGIAYEAEGLNLNITSGVNSIANSSGFNSAGLALSNSNILTTAAMVLNSHSPSISITNGDFSNAIILSNVGLGQSILNSSSNISIEGTDTKGINLHHTNSNSNSAAFLTSYGRIDVIGDSSDAISFSNFTNGHSTITAAGDITLNGDGINTFGDFTNGINVSTTSGTVDVNVNSNISALGDSESIGVFVDASTGATTNISVAKNKTITSSNSNAIGINSDNSTNTTVTINGSVIGGSDASNYGIISSGNSTVNVESSGYLSAGSEKSIHFLGNGTMRVNNSGTINGSILSDNGNIDHINLMLGSVTNGSISLNDMNDSVTISGGANISGVTSFNGGAGTDNLNFSNYSVNLSTISLTSNFENLNLNNNSNLIASNNITINNLNLANNTSLVAANNGKTITIGSNYSQNSAGTFKTSVLSNSDYGKLLVSGTATFDANSIISVDVLASNTLTDGQTISNVISATTLASNGFKIVDNSNIFKFDYVLNGNNVDLVTTNVSNLVSKTIAQNNSGATFGTITALNDIINSSSTNSQELVDAISNLKTTEEIAKAVEQLTPLISNQISNVNATNNVVTNIVSDRVSTAQGFNSGDELLATKSLWIKPFKSLTRQYDQDNIKGYSADNYGIAIGGDKEISQNNLIGLALSFSNSKVDSSSDAKQEVESESYQAKIYGSHNLDKLTLLSAQLGVGYSKYKSMRLINFGGFNEVAKADYDGWNNQVNLKLERRFNLNKKSSFIPFIKTDYSYVNVEEYPEEGANTANLSIDKASDDTLIFGTGLRYLYAFSKNFSSSLNAGIGYDFFADKSVLTARFEGNQSRFTTTAMKPDPVIYDLGLSTAYNLDVVKLSANYNLNARNKYQDHNASINFRFDF